MTPESETVREDRLRYTTTTHKQRQASLAAHSIRPHQELPARSPPPSDPPLLSQAPTPDRHHIPSQVAKACANTFEAHAKESTARFTILSDKCRLPEITRDHTEIARDCILQIARNPRSLHYDIVARPTEHLG